MEKKFLYAAFSGKSVYVGISKNIKKRVWEHRSDGPNASPLRVRKLFRSRELEIIVYGEFREDVASNKENAKIKYFRRMGYDVLNKSIGRLVGKANFKWTTHKLAKVCKGKTATELVHENCGAYRQLLRSKDRDYLLGLMEKRRKKNPYKLVLV